MAGYVTPSTQSASSVIPTSRLNAYKTALDHLAQNKAHCRVYNNATQSLTTATLTALTFNSERVDVGGMHSTSVNTSRITVPTGEGGWYDFGGNVEFAANVTGDRRAYLRVNGTTYVAVAATPALVGGSTSFLNVTCKYQLAAGDYIELVAFQNSGGALNSAVSGNYAPEFWATWEAV